MRLDPFFPVPIDKRPRLVRTFPLAILFQSGTRESVFALAAIPRETCMLHQGN
jgi:hypothetical protein